MHHEFQSDTGTGAVRANSGDYNNASEVVREALRLLKRQDEHQALKLEQLRQAIREGDDALARGDYTDLKNDDAVDSLFAGIEPMRTTITIDNDLLEQAASLTRIGERPALIREALRALIERESARRLARLGGSQPDLEPAPRRRPACTG